MMPTNTDELHAGTGGMRVLSGGWFYHLSPRAEDVNISDIANAMARIPRWTGQTHIHIPLAVHCFAAQKWAEVICADASIQLTAQIHDAHEAYTNDINRPMKLALPEIREMEHRIASVVIPTLGGQWPLPASVKVIDEMLNAYELEVYQGEPSDVENIRAMAPEDVRGVYDYWTEIQHDTTVARYHRALAGVFRQLYFGLLDKLTAES